VTIIKCLIFSQPISGKYKTVITYTKPVIGGQFLEATSKEMQLKDGEPLTGCYISLQSESHPIEFKNIEISKKGPICSF
jgi:hypothetical protein